MLSKENFEKQKNQRIGETAINKQGLLAKITEYYNATNITIEFEDGFVLKNKTYANFKKGAILNKNFDRTVTLGVRLGETNVNKYGMKMEIIRYGNANDIDVLFENGVLLKNKTYANFKNCTMENKLCPSFSSTGYIGEGDFPTNFMIGNKNVWDIWISMVQRCNNENNFEIRPNYEGCHVHEDWLNYQNFVTWYRDNYYEIPGQRMDLDKDILLKGNKLYSEDTCIIVPQRINSLFVNSRSIRGAYYIGVSFDKKSNKYRAKFQKDNKTINIRSCNTPEGAFYAYKERKEEYIKQIADEYRLKYPQFPQKVYDAMYAYKIEITD